METISTEKSKVENKKERKIKQLLKSYVSCLNIGVQSVIYFRSFNK